MKQYNNHVCITHLAILLFATIVSYGQFLYNLKSQCCKIIVPILKKNYL